ncbi:hypothetical protein [Gluconobacter oxydans]|uniref:hypothetical protein n=1 Tax=Gluconobacter oxydans TaxID=442 RepID=UPI0034530C72
MTAELKNKMLKAASLAHRQKKNESADDVQAWRERAAAIGWEHHSVMGTAEATELSVADRHDQAYAFAAKHLGKEFETAAVLDHDKLRMYAARGLIGAGIPGALKTSTRWSN